MAKNISKEVWVKAPRERVWAAITESEQLSQWFMKTDDFEPVEGAKFLCQDKPQGKWDGKILGEIIRVNEPSELVYTFWGNQMTYTTTVRWTLSEHEGGTAVKVDHTGFEGFSGWFMAQVISYGWKQYFSRLLKHLE